MKSHNVLLGSDAYILSDFLVVVVHIYIQVFSTEFVEGLGNLGLAFVSGHFESHHPETNMTVLAISKVRDHFSLI
jgi:hypothetical protein